MSENLSYLVIGGGDPMEKHGSIAVSPKPTSKKFDPGSCMTGRRSGTLLPNSEASGNINETFNYILYPGSRLGLNMTKYHMKRAIALIS